MLCYIDGLCKAPYVSGQSQQLHLVLPSGLPLSPDLTCTPQKIAHRVPFRISFEDVA